MNKPKTALLPHEVFALIAAKKTVDERVQVLKDNASFTLRTILQVNFREDLVFPFPEGAPPYNVDEAPAGVQPGSIHRNIKILPHLLEGGKLDQTRKENKFIQLLESVHAKDALIIIDMKDKVLHKNNRGLTEATVLKAFPNLQITAK